MLFQTFKEAGMGPSHSLRLPSGKRRIDSIKKKRNSLRLPSGERRIDSKKGKEKTCLIPC